MITRCIRLGKPIIAASIIYLGFVGHPIAQSQFASKPFVAEPASWKPFLNYSAGELNLPAPDEKNTRKELTEIKTKMAKVDDRLMQRIKYWDAGAPSFRWNEIATSMVTFENIYTFMRFPTAWVNMAIYDATLAAWKAKDQYKRSRPFQADATIKPLVASPATRSYPCEHTVTASAAAHVLAYFFPEKADSILELAKEAGESRIYAGVQYPSDVEAAWTLGKQVASRVVEQARKDGADAKYTDPLPTDPKLWRGEYPVGINVRKYKPVFMKSGDQFRPAAPPDFTEEMKEMKAFKQDFRSMNLAFHWASLTGFDIWTELASKKIFEERLDHNTPLCARIYAMLHATQYDVGIAIMDAKYAYWGIRPNLMDTSYRPLIFTPPFPGYPSGHATASSAAATILSYFFPADKHFFKQLAQECADSRFYAGIHFTTDNKAGIELGENVANYVIDTWGRQGTLRR
jgi:membrane-associated phospholipid phosphatase